MCSEIRTCVQTQILPCNACSLSTYCVLDTVLGPGDAAEDVGPALTLPTAHERQKNEQRNACFRLGINALKAIKQEDVSERGL